MNLRNLNVKNRTHKLIYKSLHFEGQFGFKQTIHGIPQNATLDELWNQIEIHRISFASKSSPMSTVYNYGHRSQLSVIHDYRSSVYPEFFGPNFFNNFNYIAWPNKSSN